MRLAAVPRYRAENREAHLPALVGAHLTGRPALVAWAQPRPADPVRILLGGSLAAQDGIAYPPGAHGEPLPPPYASELVAELPSWVRCSGLIQSDTTDVRPTDRLDEAGFDLFEHCVAGLRDTGFAWLVLAEPVSDEDLRRRADTLARLLPAARDQRPLGPAHEVRFARAAAEHGQLVIAERSGLWWVHLLAGGPDRAVARRAAALLCTALAPECAPYAPRPADKVGNLAETWAAATPRPTAEPITSSPFLAASPVLAALARPPRREVPGIRVTPASRFDVTPEVRGPIELGTVLDSALRPAGPLTVALDTVNRHTFVCGATGAGKSHTVRGLLEQLSDVDIPWLVIEPAKAEYAAMAGRLAGRADVTVIRPGDPDVPPVGLNPLEPEPGFPLQTHLDLVRALFLAAFQQHEPFPQVLSMALTRCYTDLGWDLVSGRPRPGFATPRYPGLADLRRTALRVVDEIGYGQEIARNVRGFVDVRIGSLQLGTPGRFFQGGHRVELRDLLNRNVVLELEDVGDDQDKAFLIGTIVIRLTEHLRRTGAARRLRHVTVIEEAHRLLKAPTVHTPAVHAVELFASLLAEIRAYGEGIIVAEQIPSKIISDVVKNSALKIMHRTPARDDRDAVGATMNLDTEQSEYVVALPAGLAAVAADGMDHPVLTRMPDRGAAEDPSTANRIPPISRCRSGSCGPLCRARPCTLREITDAAHAAEEPRLALWVELVAVAHVLGRPAPAPAPRWRRTLVTRHAERELRCALAQLCDAAVDRRYAALVPHYAPVDLAEHLADRLSAVLAGAAHSCAGERRWQAGAYRWADVYPLLMHGNHPPDRPHPQTEAWLARGLDLTGLPASEQLAVVRREFELRKADRTALDGSGTVPEYQRLAAMLSPARDELARLKDAVAPVLVFPPTWSLDSLFPTPQRGEPS